MQAHPNPISTNVEEHWKRSRQDLKARLQLSHSICPRRISATVSRQGTQQDKLQEAATPHHLSSQGVFQSWGVGHIVGWKERAFWDCIQFMSMRVLTKTKLESRSGWEQGVTVGLWGSPVSLRTPACLYRWEYLGWWLWDQGVPMSRCQQLAIPGQPLSRSSTWAQLLAGSSKVCTHILPLPELPLLKQKCLSALSACLIPSIHTQCTSLPAGIHWIHFGLSTSGPWGLKQQLPYFSEAVRPSTMYFPPRQNRCFQATIS